MVPFDLIALVRNHIGSFLQMTGAGMTIATMVKYLVPEEPRYPDSSIAIRPVMIPSR